MSPLWVLFSSFGHIDCYIVGCLPHKFEFPVRWNERDRVLCLELAQLDALMELAVVNRDRALGSSSVFARLS